jgi:hypothetical protein
MLTPVLCQELKCGLRNDWCSSSYCPSRYIRLCLQCLPFGTALLGSVYTTWAGDLARVRLSPGGLWGRLHPGGPAGLPCQSLGLPNFVISPCFSILWGKASWRASQLAKGKTKTMKEKKEGRLC